MTGGRLALVVVLGLVGILISAGVLFIGLGTLGLRFDPPRLDPLAGGGRDWARPRDFDPREPIPAHWGNAELEADLLPFFQRFRAAVEVSNQNTLEGFFDSARLLDEAVRNRPEQPLVVPERRGAVEEAMRRSVGNILALHFALELWTREKVHKVLRLGDPGEIEALVHHFHEPTGTNNWHRWRLKRTVEGWRIMDIELLDLGLKLSTLAGIQAEALPGPDVEAVRGLLEGVQAFRQRQDDQAVQRLQALDKGKHQPHLEAARLIVLGVIHVQRRHYPEALRCYEQAARHHPDFPRLDLERAWLHNQLRKHDQALTHARKFLESVGEDSAICYHLGQALAGLKRHEEAAAAFRKALEFDTQGASALDDLRKVLPAGKKAELGEWLVKMAHPLDAFVFAAPRAQLEQDAEGLDVLAQALLGLFPEDPEATCALARARVLQNRGDEAIPLFQQAIRTQVNPQKRQQYARDMAFDLLELGRGLDAYRQAPDADLAFSLLADTLSQRRSALLPPLLDLHAQRQPNDPVLLLYRGALLLDEGKLAEAEKLLARAARGLPNHLEVSQRDLRARVWFHSGKALQALEQLQPRRETFRVLTWLCRDQKKWAELDQLLKAQRRHDPADPLLLTWEVQLPFMQDNHAAALAALERNRLVLLQQPSYTREQARHWLVQCLARLKKLHRLEDEVDRWRVQGDDLREWADVLGMLNRARDSESIEAVARVLAQRPPQNADERLQLARINVHLKQYDQAVTLFQGALAQQPNEQTRSNYTQTFLFALVDVGQPVVGYRAVADRRHAFGVLAPDLIVLKKGAELKRLLGEHEGAHPNDPKLNLYRGELALQEKKYAEAERLLQQVVLDDLDAYQRDHLRRLQLQTWVHLGKAVQAYRTFGKDRLTFLALADLCSQHRQPDQLEQLVGEHRVNDGTWPDLLLWEGEVYWLRGDHARVVQHLRQQRARLTSIRLQLWKFEDRLVRSLVRLKRFDEATREVDAFADRVGDHLTLQAVIRASAGDVVGTTAIFEKAERRRHPPSSFYLDPDLGPLLRSEPFRALRERFPEPPPVVPGFEDDFD